MNPESFIPALTADVNAIQSQDETCSFTGPGATVQNPFTGEPQTINAPEYKTTRDVLCFAASIDPCTDDDEIERDQLRGYIFT